MFFAMMLACSPMLPTGCLIVEDNRGPYDTLQECEARYLEMSRDFGTMFPFELKITPACNKVSSATGT